MVGLRLFAKGSVEDLRVLVGTAGTILRALVWKDSMTVLKSPATWVEKDMVVEEDIWGEGLVEVF